MAEAKKSVATRKRASKGRKARAKGVRKKVTKRGRAKLATKKRRPSKAAARKSPRKGKAPRKTPRKVIDAPVEQTIVDVVEEPAPGVIVVTEYETVRTEGVASPSPSEPSSPDAETEVK